MKLDFAKNTKRNMLASMLNKFVGLLLPFLNRTLFLWLLGPEYLGLNGLFLSILGVLSLAELGFGTAVVCSMYKSVADDDRELVCAYLRFYRTVYRWVGAAILVVGLCLLPFLRTLVRGDLPPGLDLHVLYLIHLVNTSVSYFLFAYRGAVLSAHHRGDVIANIRTGTTIAQYLTVFAILILTRNYYHYVAAIVAFTVLNNLLVVWQARRLYPHIQPRGRLSDDKRRQVLSQVKAIAMHKFGGIVTFSSDNMIISAFLGLVAVAAYGNYHYVVTAVSGLIWCVYASMTDGFGNKVHTETKDANFRLFMGANRLVCALIAWSAAMMIALYQPFIAVWTQSNSNPSLMRHFLTPALMVTYFFISQSRQLLLQFKGAAAIWQPDRWKSVLAGVVNLELNILFVTLLPPAYRLDGVIFSTILSIAVIEIPWEAHVLFTAYFRKEDAGRYWRAQFRSAGWTLFLGATTWASVSFIALDGLPGLAVKGVIALAVSGGLTCILFRHDMAAFAKRIRHRVVRRDGKPPRTENRVCT
jgi:O-antigen/teichoic acid export membrane protein